MSKQELTKKYGLVIESVKQLYEFDFGSGGEMSTADVSEDQVLPGKQIALDRKQAGLFEPDTPEEQQQLNIALSELNAIITRLTSGLEAWRKKYSHLGAQDTVSREAVNLFIANNRLGVKTEHQPESNV